MADIIITTTDEALSDGSKTHSVVVRDQSLARAIVIPAITHNDALDLASKIADAINDHTNMKAEWR